jgi:hypothetical protein
METLLLTGLRRSLAVQLSDDALASSHRPPGSPGPMARRLPFSPSRPTSLPTGSPPGGSARLWFDAALAAPRETFQPGPQLPAARAAGRLRTVPPTVTIPPWRWPSWPRPSKTGLTQPPSHPSQGGRPRRSWKTRLLPDLMGADSHPAGKCSLPCRRSG